MDSMQLKLDEIKPQISAREWEIRFLALQKLQGFPPEMVEDILVSALEDNNDNVRYIAVKSLGYIKSIKSVDALIRSYADPNSLIRLQVIEALGKIADSSCLQFLVQFLQDEGNVRVRATIIKEIGRLGSMEYFPVLAIYLNDPDDRVRANTIEALDLLGGASLPELVGPFLADPNNRIKANAVRSMSRFAPEKSLAVLREMLADNNEWMRASACYVIGELKENRAAVETVLALDDSHWFVVRNASEALIKMGNHCLPAVYSRLSDSSVKDEVLMQLLNIIGETGNSGSLDKIIPLLKHANGEIRNKTEEAIDKIKERS
ncbi:MAG: HEAT repeat domain-containing protein [Candidatus Wallbacteria bacterium]|nr:HEAT repeat domain-containing protein [Candidatus Wallbacteria bacterium]